VQQFSLAPSILCMQNWHPLPRIFSQKKTWKLHAESAETLQRMLGIISQTFTSGPTTLLSALHHQCLWLTCDDVLSYASGHLTLCSFVQTDVYSDASWLIEVGGAQEVAIFRQSRLWALKISLLPINVPKMGVFSPKHFIYGRTFSIRRKFSDSFQQPKI